MHHNLPMRPLSSCAGPDGKLPPKLASALAQANLPDLVEVEQAVSFGRWWLDMQTSQLVLSIGAAGFLNVNPGWHRTLESCFAQVVPDDVLMLMSALAQASVPGKLIDCEFRVVHALDGLRWLRMLSLPHALARDAVQTGVLVDITSSRLAAMRERFSFESAQFLVGAHTLGEAVTKVIQLVCENLGWEWGAYWSLEQDQMGAHKFACQHYWHKPESTLTAFTRESCAIRIAPGEGLVGHVWSTGQANWIKDMANDPDCMRRKNLRASGLQSGYAFPVSYMTADGRRHSPGVLEFFSRLPRQHEAQLPNLSATIGTLIAQAVQRHEQQEYIRQLAQIDDLTGLANRNYFHRLLDTACHDATQSGKSFGVFYIDLDRFKPINDAFGHEVGNGVLREFAQRLRKLVPDGCLVGRLGGDEFAILLTPAESKAQLRALAERVLLAAHKPFMFGENECAVSASVGISIFPENGRSGPELLRCADAAMYSSKKNGRNVASFFSGDPLPQSSLVQQLTMEAELHRALLGDEFFLEYQPIFDVLGERMAAVEALIRWRRQNGEIVRPDTFIPIAEKSGLIVQIGRWVVGQACRDLPLLHRAGFTDLQVNVNMAAPEFINANLPTELAAVIAASGIAAHHLCLELTEGMVMEQPDKVIPVMSALRQRGFKISLDDFGMGHSSLSRLKQLPITSLKIDRSFVSGLPHDCGDGAIVRTILDLGRHMKLRVIAEGVETDAQLVFLRQFGCTLVQGFVLGRPMPAADLVALHRPHSLFHPDFVSSASRQPTTEDSPS